MPFPKPLAFTLRTGHRLAPNRLAWPMTESGSRTLRDATRGGRDGTLGAAMTWDRGVFGPCLRFDGSSTALITFDPVTLGTTFWFAVWLFPESSAKDYRSILTLNDAQGMFLRGSGVLDWYDGGNHTSMTTVTLGTWNHIAFSCQGGNGMFFFNGVADASTLLSLTSFAPNRIGNDPSNESYTGLMDGIFATAGASLSPTMAATLYRNHWAAFRTARIHPAFLATAPAGGGAPIAPLASVLYRRRRVG